MARPVLLALLALLFVLPASAAAAPKRGQDIRKVEAVTTSAGALVRVTLRAPLDGRISVRFRNRAGRGNPRSSAVAHRGRQVLFVFAGEARNLSRVFVSTSGDRASLKLPRRIDNCAALTRLARGLRPIRAGRPAIQRRLRAVARHRAGCRRDAAPDLPAPPVVRGFASPVARYSLAHGLTPEDPIEGGTDVRFADASAGSELVKKALGLRRRRRRRGPGRVPRLRARPLHGAAHGRELARRRERVRPPALRARPRQHHGRHRPRRVPRPGRERDRQRERPRALVGPHARPGRLRARTWGRRESTLRFSFDLSDGTGSGTVSPSVTAGWS